MSRPGAGMYVCAPPQLSAFDLKTVLREAQHGAQSIDLRDQDGTRSTSATEAVVTQTSNDRAHDRSSALDERSGFLVVG